MFIILLIPLKEGVKPTDSLPNGTAPKERDAFGDQLAKEDLNG
jgi:hypothetical protein